MDNRCLFFFDFDNTLYSHATKRVPDSAQEAMFELTRQGHILAVVSGRGREGLTLFPRELKCMPATVALLNGQMVYVNGEIMYDNHLTLTDTAKVFDIARKHDLAYGAYYWDGIIVNTLNERVQTVWTEFEGPFPAIEAGFESKHPIYQAQLYITEEEKELFAGEIDHYITNWSHRYLVNLIHKSAGKANAIKWCREYYGISMENTYAIGDAFNDLDMIRAVGHGIAMGNGSDDIKEAAEYVTDDVDRDGVYKALQHYGFLK